jgi:glycine cleavage system H protein
MATEIPADLRYTAEHEWVAATGSVCRVGITAFAGESLGDVVFVQLPEIGAAVAAGDSLGEVESTKSVSELYAPVAGTVTARNDALDATPELVNSDPYGEGWIVEITVDGEAADLDGLLDADGYAAVAT